MSGAIHGDMKQRVVVHTAALPWQQSPAAGVWRKRLHRVGPEESGQVTSLVRFDAGSSFDEHGHPSRDAAAVLKGGVAPFGGHKGYGLSFAIQACNRMYGIDKFPNLKGFLDRIHARPAYKRALERGGPYAFGS